MTPLLVETAVPGEPLPIRSFRDLNIQAQIDGAIAKLENAKKGAAITYEGQDGAHKVALVVKFNTHFSVAVADHIEAGAHAVGGSVIAAW